MKRCIAVLVAAIFMAVPFSTRAAGNANSAQTILGKLQWRSIGPYIGGRVVAVAGVPSNPNLFYMGGVQGGIWKSTNYGQNWTNISDGQLPMTANAIGALAVSASNPKVIYAGTGEADIRGDFATGDGIYRSADAGKTWHYAGLRETHMTTSLVVDPRDSNVVYATSMGHVFKPNAERGVFKTTDGGKTWRNILFIDDRTGSPVIVMDAHAPNVLYASMWQAQRTPWNLTSGGPGSGLYKTTDGGAHWTKISSHPGFASGVLGKMGISVSGADSRVVYATVQAHEGGIFRSNDGGATWKRVNSEMKLRQRAFYYMGIYADPKNANVAYAPEVDSVFKTSDGGRTWKSLTPPGDHHIVWINPHDTKILLEGDDGGATVSVDGGTTWSTENNQPTGQYYHVALDDQFPFHVYGAAQDEGAFEGPSASAEGLTLGAWHSVAFGESTFVAPQPGDPNITYGSGYYSALMRMNTPLGTVKNVSPWPKYMSGASAGETKYRFGWTHPIFFSPVNPHELLSVAQVVFKSDDDGKTWQVISPDLTRDDKSSERPSGGPVDLDQTGAETFPDISSLAVSPLTGDVMWAGSADGLVHVTTNAGAHWTAVTPPSLPQWAQISSIEPSRVDKATAYLTASRYMWDDFHPYVFKTTDYGAHWTPMASGIPSDQYVFTVRQDPRDPRVLVAGTRSTVYASLNGGASWQPLTLNLPGVQVRDLAFDARQGDLVAATHGRAFWVLDNVKLLEQLAGGVDGNASTAQLFAPEGAWLSHAYGGGGSPVPGTGENPAYGATVVFKLPANYNGSVPASLTYKDTAGNTIRSFALHRKNKKEKKLAADVVARMDHVHQLAHDLHELTGVEPGTNVFRWDLRYEPATEINGFRMPTADDIDDGVSGPTVVPGSYVAVLNYGGKTSEQAFTVSLDPREHPTATALADRLALAMRVHGTLDALNRAINTAFASRARLSAAKRAELDAALSHVVQMQISSSEGDLLHQTQLRDHLAFLMNELDTAYDAPTAAEASLYDELHGEAASAIAKLAQIEAAR